MRFTDAYSLPALLADAGQPADGQVLGPARHHQRHRSSAAAAGRICSSCPRRRPPTGRSSRPRARTTWSRRSTRWPRRCATAGYRTAHIGKWHLGLTEPYWPERQGFDVAFHGHPDPGPPSYFSPYKYRAGTITDGPTGEYIIDRLTDEAVQFIEANRDRPFFLNLWHYGVHGPWGHKEELHAALRRQEGSARQAGQSDHGLDAQERRRKSWPRARRAGALEAGGQHDRHLQFRQRRQRAQQHARRSPRAATRRTMPRLADWRKWAGEQPPTNNDPLRNGKGTLYEGGMRVPLMVAWPGVIQPGTTRPKWSERSTSIRPCSNLSACRGRRSRRWTA